MTLDNDQTTDFQEEEGILAEAQATAVRAASKHARMRQIVGKRAPRFMRVRSRLWRRRVRRGRLRAVQIYLRFAPAEQQRVFILTLLIGIVCGLTAVAFHIAIRVSENYLIKSALSTPDYLWIPLTILTPTLGGLIAGALLQYVVPEARGSGIPQIKVAYAIKGGRVPLRSIIGKFFIGALQIGSGASLGREGPTVQICAGIASALGRGAALSRQQMRRMVPVGAAAGIAAAFNAPIAAVTFTIEEIIGDLDNTMLSGVVIAAALAAVIERNVLGEHPVFSVPQEYGLHHPSSLGFYLLLGVLAAGISLFFTSLLLGMRTAFSRMKQVPPWARPGIGGFVVGMLAVIVALWMPFFDQPGRTLSIVATGFETLGAALNGSLPLQALVVLCILKVIATAFSYSSGGAGGIFAPALFIGGMLGGSVGFLDVLLLGHEVTQIGAFALVGMGAVFAGVVRAPITSVLIIFEMTGGYELILPLMIANTIAYALARHWQPMPIYEALLAQDGIHLHSHHQPGAHGLGAIRVESVMTRNVVTLPDHLTVDQAEKIAEIFEHAALPVVDSAGSFVGFGDEARLRRAQAAGQGEHPLRKFVDARPKIAPDQSLLRALVRMHQLRVGELAVVERDDRKRLLGILSMTDIMHAQAQAIDPEIVQDEAGRV